MTSPISQGKATGSNRLLLWLVLLVLMLVVRWIDPLKHASSTPTVSEPVERAKPIAVVAAATAVTPALASQGASSAPLWPTRASLEEKHIGNAFMTRADAAQEELKRRPAPKPVPPPPPPPPTPPPPPVIPPPPLQVIGTWGEANNLAVFLSGPQGTLLAHAGDVLLAEYKVQSITKQQITLLQNSNQRLWNIPVPTAPSTLQTWPAGR